MSDTYVVKNENGWYAEECRNPFGLRWTKRCDATRGTHEYAVRLIRRFYQNGGNRLCWLVKPRKT